MAQQQWEEACLLAAREEVEEVVAQRRRQLGFRVAAAAAAACFDLTCWKASPSLRGAVSTGVAESAEGATTAILSLIEPGKVSCGWAICDSSWATGGVDGTCGNVDAPRTKCWSCCCEALFPEDYHRAIAWQTMAGGAKPVPLLDTPPVGWDEGHHHHDHGLGSHDDGFLPHHHHHGHGGNSLGDPMDDHYYDDPMGGGVGHHHHGRGGNSLGDPMDDRYYDNPMGRGGGLDNYGYGGRGDGYGRGDDGYGHGGRGGGYGLQNQFNRGEMVYVEGANHVWRKATIIRPEGRMQYRVKYEGSNVQQVVASYRVALGAAYPWWMYLLWALAVVLLIAACAALVGFVLQQQKRRRFAASSRNRSFEEPQVELRPPSEGRNRSCSMWNWAS